ncbi:MAG: HK97 gp10 family phage protein [Oscillospiraceae bacterium]|nr:MAG TPA: putative tail component [Caudoviricetes sp.]
MGVRKDGLTQYIQQLEALKADIPAIMSKIATGEGDYAVKQARLICKNDHVVSTGAYRRNWQSDKAAKRSGHRYIVRFYNPLDYASHLEYGFRSHFVPGHWEGKTFVYSRNDPKGGMYVGPKGGYVRGKFVMRRAIKRTKDTQKVRIERKIMQEIKKRLEGR